MISIDENITSCQMNIQKLTDQRNDITNEILRLEGSIRTLRDLKRLGVSIIETTEVLDIDAVVPIESINNSKK